MTLSVSTTQKLHHKGWSSLCNWAPNRRYSGRHDGKQLRPAHFKGKAKGRHKARITGRTQTHQRAALSWQQCPKPHRKIVNFISSQNPRGFFNYNNLHFFLFPSLFEHFTTFLLDNAFIVFDRGKLPRVLLPTWVTLLVAKAISVSVSWFLTIIGHDEPGVSGCFDAMRTLFCCLSVAPSKQMSRPECPANELPFTMPVRENHVELQTD